MPNTTDTAVAQTQLYDDYVLKGFVSTLAPLMIFSTDISPAPSERGYTVNISYLPSGSNPYEVGTSGYNSFATTRVSKTVTIDQHYAVGSALSDKEIANSTLMKIEDSAYNDGAALATYVFQNVVGKISGSNFAAGVNVATSSNLTSDDLLNVRKFAGNLKIPLNGRAIVLNVNGMHGLLKDDDLKYIYRGTTDATMEGVVGKFFGVNGVYEVNGYPTDIVSGSNKGIGFLASKDALLFASRTLTPSPLASDAGVQYSVISDSTTGLSLGVRRWYDATLGTEKRIYEALWGSAVGNPKAAVNITATVDA